MGSGSSESTLDQVYIRGIPGIMKMLEVILSFIAFLCAIIGGNGSCGLMVGFFNFVIMTGCVLTLLLWLIFLCKLQHRIFKCDCCKWPFIEFIYYVLVVISFFFVNLFMAIFGCKLAHDVGCAFGFLALIVYIVDFFMSFRVFWSWRKEQRTETTVTTGGTTSSTTVTQVTSESSVRY